MTTLYIFSLVLGGGLLAFSLLGDTFGDHGDMADHDTDGAKFLSLRTISYFLFVFGAVGAALTWGWRGASPVLTSVLAGGAGLLVSGVSAAVFSYLRRSSSGDTQGEESFVGLAGTVIVPIGAGGAGKVIVRRGDRAFELTARPFETDAAPPNTWRSVVIVEMQRGTALVAPLEDTTASEA